MPARRAAAHDAPRELGRIGVRLARRIVMHVVEFGDRRVAGLQPSRRYACAAIASNASASMRSRNAYIACRHVQKLSSRLALARPVRPAIARWNACECRFGIAGTSGPAATLRAVAGVPPRARRRVDRCPSAAIVDRDVARQPPGGSASRGEEPHGAASRTLRRSRRRRPPARRRRRERIDVQRRDGRHRPRRRAAPARSFSRMRRMSRKQAFARARRRVAEPEPRGPNRAAPDRERRRRRRARGRGGTSR